MDENELMAAATKVTESMQECQAKWATAMDEVLHQFNKLVNLASVFGYRVSYCEIDSEPSFNPENIAYTFEHEDHTIIFHLPCP